MDTEAVGMAVRVLGTAVLRNLVVDKPHAVRVYGRGLEERELRWLIDGMGLVRVERADDNYAYGGEDVQVTGNLLGRVVRVLIREDQFPQYVATLRATEPVAGAR